MDNEIKATADEELQSYIYQVEVATAIEDRLQELSGEMVGDAVRNGVKQVAQECYEVLVFEHAMKQYLEEFVESLTAADLRTGADHQLNDEAIDSCTDDQLAQSVLDSTKEVAQEVMLEE